MNRLADQLRPAVGFSVQAETEHGQWYDREAGFKLSDLSPEILLQVSLRTNLVRDSLCSGGAIEQTARADALLPVWDVSLCRRT